VKGRVLRSEGRGRTIGFPTANLKPARELPLPSGVYLVQVEWDGERASGVTNIGIRPTFGGETPWIETYLLDFSGDLYDRTLRLHFLERLRPEQRFESVQALRAQIEKDVETARRLLGHGP
jgi:riboflavin kinase/FMN adenylyltransferase